MDNYINFLSTSGRKAKAIQFVEELVNEDPERVVLRRRIIELYRQEGRIKDLVKQLDALGDILLNKGDREGAIKAIEAILALNPPNKNEYMNALARIRNM